ncbi:MAG: response regulator [Byssovorax sp.]
MDATILVVEDDALAASFIRRTLLDLGYRVPETVSSGEEAIRAAYEHNPHLVLMDIEIDGAIDGIQTATALQNLLHLPIVYLTSFADDETVARASTTMPYGYLLKPSNPRELRSTIELALHKHAEDRRRAERELCFTTMLESIEEAVISADRDGGVTFMNKAAEVVTGWARAEALGAPLRDVMRVFLCEHRPASPAEAMGYGAPGTHSAPMLLDRTRKWVVIDARSVPIVDEAGEVQGGVMVFHDFTAQMSRDRPPPSDPCARRVPDAVPPRRGRVLVIDAETQVAHAMARILGREHEVSLEVDGRSALTRLSEGEEFDVVFCDVHLPDLTGIQLYDALSRRRPELARRLVFLTSDGIAPDSKRFLESLPNVSLSKPFATESLRALVREHLR